METVMRHLTHADVQTLYRVFNRFLGPDECARLLPYEEDALGRLEAECNEWLSNQTS